METALRIDNHYTYADYCMWPEDERLELIDGAVYAKATPTRGHQSICGEIFWQLKSYLRGKPCKAFFAPLSVRLNADTYDDTVVEPDIFVVCDESKLQDSKGVVGSPDLIIEVLSPSTAKYDMKTKFDLYLKNRVHEYWIVDPELKIAVVNILHDEGYISYPYDENDSIPVHVLEGCKINLADVFEGI